MSDRESPTSISASATITEKANVTGLVRGAPTMLWPIIGTK